MSITGCDVTRKAYAAGAVDLPNILEALVHANDARHSAKRLEALYEAQQFTIELLADIQAAILVNTTKETIPVVAQRIKESAHV